MAVYPGGVWEPIGVSPGRGSNGPMHQYLGFVLHCNAAESLDLHNFELSNLDVGPTSHFQVIDDGTVYQYIDTSVSSWCQGDGNDTYLSIESQGLATELATPAQVAAIAGILAWGNQAHGIPLQLANTPGDRGLGFHGMGAAAGQDWGHSVCPGVRGNPFLYPTQDQRPAMLAAAGSHTALGGGTPISGGDDEVLSADDKAWMANQMAVQANVAVMAIVNGSGFKIAGVAIDQAWDATKEAHDRKVIANGDSAADKAITDPTGGVLVRVAQVQAAVAALHGAVTTGAPTDVTAEVNAAVTAALAPVTAAINGIPAALAAALTKGASA